MDGKPRLNRAEDFTFVNPWIRYFLFFFSFVFWVFSLLIVAIGVYAKVQKATDTVRNTFLIDPAVILIVFSLSLTLVFLTQLAVAVLGFFYSDQTRDALEKFVKKAIVHYRDDLDLQNLMDYIQKEFKCCGWNNYSDWSWNLYFNCTHENPSSERCAVPYSCCTPLPGETVINTMCGFGVQTMSHVEANESIYPGGCVDKAAMWMESHLSLVGALALGTALPQVSPLMALRIQSTHKLTNSALPLVTSDHSCPTNGSGIV
ncbi:tetraspanin-33b isoform 4-T4 [Spinachia spinachia]